MITKASRVRKYFRQRHSRHRMVLPYYIKEGKMNSLAVIRFPFIFTASRFLASVIIIILAATANIQGA